MGLTCEDSCCILPRMSPICQWEEEARCLCPPLPLSSAPWTSEGKSFTIILRRRGNICTPKAGIQMETTQDVSNRYQANKLLNKIFSILKPYTYTSRSTWKASFALRILRLLRALPGMKRCRESQSQDSDLLPFPLPSCPAQHKPLIYSYSSPHTQVPNMSSLSHSPPGKPAGPGCAWKYYILCSGGLTQEKSYISSEGPRNSRPWNFSTQSMI